jgi:mono/diheme cytochrome c family protein
MKHARFVSKRALLFAVTTLSLGLGGGYLTWGDEPGPAVAEQRAAEFNRQIAPIFAQNCLQCHNASQSSGNLNLSTRKGAIEGGDSGAAILPGDADNSYLLQRIRDGEMPPKGKGTPLTKNQVAAVEKWISAGSVWPESRTLSEFDYTTDRRAGRDWWSLQPITRPDVPGESSLEGTSRNGVDRFIRAELVTSKLTPNGEADRATLLRRLYFDVIGLPPTPEETAAFVADESPDAFERRVDELLASPRYGERWARHWLDVVRFGETDGFEVNTPRENAWPYRDYVITALNTDKPYDRFVVEQLAGDQMNVGVATGYIVGGSIDRVGINTVEGMRQQRLDQMDDMLSTTANAFLGMTLHCAKCHNHKFDPLSQADFYRFSANFAGVNHGDRAVESLDYQRRASQVPQLLARAKEIDAKLAEFDRQIDMLGEPLARAIASTNTIDPDERRAAVNPQRNVDRFAPVKAKFVRFTIEATGLYEPCIDELEIYTAGDAPTNVALASAGAKATASSVYANGSVPIHQIAHLNDGRYGNSWSWISGEVGRGWAQIELPQETTIERVVWGRDRDQKFLDRTPTSYRIEVATKPGEWTTVATHADRKPFDAKSGSPQRDIDRLGKAEAISYRGLLEEKASLQAMLPKPTLTAYAGNFSAAPPATHRLHLGDVMQPKEVVAPGGISSIAPPLELPANASDGERRRKLAEWIVDRRNPLASRVIVNRLWHYHFGQGLQATPSNFGFLGGKPSHPALLDWLAQELLARDWSLKSMHRLMLTSATWRQSSADHAANEAVDAQCRKLWRFPPRRLEAEPIRDSILAIAGTLDLRMGGKGYTVFEPNDNYVRVYTPKKKFGPAEWRRMIYQTKPRMQQDATFGDFDCPDAASDVAKRNVSTTALQALNLFNSDFMIDQAKYFAARVEREAGANDEARVRRAFELAVGRAAAPDEVADATALVDQHGMEALCRALLNASELMFVN